MLTEMLTGGVRWLTARAWPRGRGRITDGVDGPEDWRLYLDRYAALIKEGR